MLLTDSFGRAGVGVQNVVRKLLHLLLLFQDIWPLLFVQMTSN